MRPEQLNQIIINRLFAEPFVPSHLTITRVPSIVPILTGHGYAIAHRIGRVYILESYEFATLPYFLKVQAG